MQYYFIRILLVIVIPTTNYRHYIYNLYQMHKDLKRKKVVIFELKITAAQDEIKGGSWLAKTSLLDAI